ncbi:MAG: GTP-binding protein [Treponema sp.]|nr:GTP-binding protein [Spirochaetia bacterium]MDD7459985.1 GTP-binding protein [Spirochaetales bacterium]MDY5810579.1 GTP-binding protein [Treponema sp.]
MNTSSSERIHISIFGSRNAGKSTLANEILNQNLSIVSDVKGTTTDPVSKSMELLPLGPVVITDTAGYDDSGELGKKRILKTKEILNKTDIALLLINESTGKTSLDQEFENLIKEREIPYAVIFRKDKSIKEKAIQEIIRLYSSLKPQKKILAGLVKKDDIVILVCPIDQAAPKGRIILPQQMVLRELLDFHAKAIAVQPEELKETLGMLKVSPALVITDSQCFKQVSENLRSNIPLTSFSILMARYKGYLEEAVKATGKIKELKDGDKILISEGCTHRRQCGDIGSVKIPAALKKLTGRNLKIEFSSGTEFPENLSDYKLIIHCGGCMITEKELLYRMKCAQNNRVPFCNYGIFLAYFSGILEKSIFFLKTF